MSKPRECIVGAGLAGLIAAHAWPRATVMEVAPQPAASHRALLRFRTDAVSTLTGVPFKQVRVNKSVWFRGRHGAADIRTANMYTQKVLGSLVGDRSIWNTTPVDRYVAPESLYEQLIESVGPRLLWGTAADYEAMGATRQLLVNTAPLPVVLDALHVNYEQEFRRAPIAVARYRVPGANVFQTVYFPTHEHSVYRASITGDLLIVEHAGEDHNGDWLDDVLMAFGLNHADFIDFNSQRYGKIVDVDPAWRKQNLLSLTTHFNIYSLGRFATWRNILLDDVVHDITVIKAMVRNTGGDYDRHRSALGS
jgi:hypothetical protein